MRKIALNADVDNINGFENYTLNKNTTNDSVYIVDNYLEIDWQKDTVDYIKAIGVFEKMRYDNEDFINLLQQMYQSLAYGEIYIESIDVQVLANRLHFNQITLEEFNSHMYNGNKMALNLSIFEKITNRIGFKTIEKGYIQNTAFFIRLSK